MTPAMKGAQRHRQAGHLHQHARRQNHEKGGRDHRFLGTGSGNELKQRIEQIAAGHKQGDDGADRDRDIDVDRATALGAGRCNQGYQRQDWHDRDILEQQDREGLLAIAGVQIAAFFQDLDAECRR
jgi:hypothetical protein